MRRRNPLRPLLVLVLAALSIVALAERAAAQTVVSDPLPELRGHRAPDGEMREVVAIEIDTAPDVLAAIEAQRARVRADLASARRRHIAMLRRYANAMSFPVNSYEPGRLNVFVDDQGHICAAANLIARDGHRDLVDITASQDNHVRLVEVIGGPVMAWILASGFTQEEIGRIQEPYEYIDDELPRRAQQRAVEDERRRVRAVLLAVALELERNTQSSLDVATDRLIAARIAEVVAAVGPAVAPAS